MKNNSDLKNYSIYNVRVGKNTFQVYGQDLEHAEAIAFRTTTHKVSSIIEDIPEDEYPDFIFYDMFTYPNRNVSMAEYRKMNKLPRHPFGIYVNTQERNLSH